jgi:hypothetical protein
MCGALGRSSIRPDTWWDAQKKFVGLTGVGVQIETGHRYRVTVFYSNATGQTLAEGGMGVVAGLFKPAKDVAWPTAVTTDSLYVRDLRHYLRLGPASALAVRSRSAAPSTP